MPTTFANTINGNEILAKRSQCDYAGNDLQTTYATKTEVSTGLASKEDSANKAQTLDPSSSTDFPSSAATANYVNSSVATATANFLGNFTLTDLGLTYPATDAQIGAALDAHTWPTGVTPTNNDYTYIEIENPQTTGIDDSVERFKFNGTNWVYEYTLNNSTFTAAEKAAIDSGIDSAKVAVYDAHVADTDIHVTLSDKSTWNAKQDAISDLATIRSGAQAGATAVQPGDLATVATTGAYSDLSGTPTIPPALSAGNGIDITNNVVSADLDGTSLTNGANGLSVTLPVPDTTGASQGDVLSVGQSGIEWVTPGGGGGDDAVLTYNVSTWSDFTTAYNAGKNIRVIETVDGSTHEAVLFEYNPNGSPYGYAKFTATILGGGVGAVSSNWYQISNTGSGVWTRGAGTIQGNYSGQGAISVNSASHMISLTLDGSSLAQSSSGLAVANPLPSTLGTAGQVLQVNSGATGVEWATPSGGSVTDVEVNGTSVVNASGVAEVTVPAQVNADWNSSSGASEILNKPTIPSGTQLVPAATSADEDKVLTVDSQGVPGWASAQAPISAGDGIDITNNVVSAVVSSPLAINTDDEIWLKTGRGLDTQAGLQSDELEVRLSGTGGLMYDSNDDDGLAIQLAQYSGLEVQMNNGVQEGLNVLVDGTTIDKNASGELTVIGGGGGGTQADWTEDDPTASSYIENKPTPKTLTAGTNITITESSSTLTVAATWQNAQADWTETDPNEPAYIQHKPSLATVATSGDYTDLSNTPTIPTVDQTYDGTSANAQSGVAVADAIGNLPTNLTAAQIQALKEALGIDETVLWEDSAGVVLHNGITLSESRLNFEYLRLTLSCQGKSTTPMCYVDIPMDGVNAGSNFQFQLNVPFNNETTATFALTWKVLITATDTTLQSTTALYWGKSGFDGTSANAGTWTQGSNANVPNIYKVVGIRRIAST